MITKAEPEPYFHDEIILLSQAISNLLQTRLVGLGERLQQSEGTASAKKS